MKSIGSLALVLHTHLPWLPGHGTWPVGEEWLYQAWSGSYLRLVDLLLALQADGRRDVLTLGVTPTIAAMLDDPACLAAEHTWLADWQLRATGMCADRNAGRRRTGQREFAEASRALAAFETRWQRGASPLLRDLSDTRVIEILGGPLMHPFQPLLQPATQRAALAWGLQDARLRLGQRPVGLWAPECGYAPGLESSYAREGISHFLVDGPTMRAAGHDTFAGRTVAGSGVVAFARDLDVTYRVWSPRRGYPGGKWYRDFHTYDHAWGVRPSRVTSRQTPPHQKAPYDPQRARQAVQADAADFVEVVRQRLAAAPTARPLVVAAYDTELFGHWWHEGPQWLAEVVRLLPEAGIATTTLHRAVRDGLVAGNADLPAGSWGSGKDWRVWDGVQVQDLRHASADLESQVVEAIRDSLDGTPSQRDPVLDQMARELLLTCSSDWAFMVTKDSAADYARRRAQEHRQRALALVQAVRSGDARQAAHLVAEQRVQDRGFGHVDARLLERPSG
ncbi:MAG: DUF1957 domain-containing protein [Actinomycetales bacterium]|nr:DUF1957 domain-containing protein [Actinomycetales bacterium]